jgi:GNAT superfamily N-acetyltransferase
MTVAAMISERIEREALASLHAAADPATAARLRLGWREIGAGAASIAAGLPASAIVVNRVLGLSTAGDLQEAVAAYRAAGVARFFVNGPVEDPGGAVAAEAAALGLMQTRGWRKFVRGREEPVPEVAAPFPIREIGPAEGPAFAAIVAAAFDLGAEAEPWLARLPGHDGWRVFGAFDGATLVGVGGLFRLGDAAWTDWGATDPRWRGRGVQRAVLAHRVRAALEGGARELHTCTGEAVPGEPQHSYANILRCGFREAALRPNFAPPKQAA